VFPSKPPLQLALKRPSALEKPRCFDVVAGGSRCNCTLCSKARAWFLFVRGDRPKVLAGKEVLSTYRWVPPGRA
jgi:hypothetical protein